MYDDDKRKNDEVSTYPIASFGARFIAYFIDAIILGIISGLVVATTGRGESFALSTLVSFLYYWYFWTNHDGQSPGKRIMKIKVVKTTGEPLTAVDVLARVFGYWLSGMAFGLGFLWAAFDSKSQGWHDKIAGTYVVEAYPEKQKYVTL
jgi:uncharacterized RDD family membrane protein YckC